MVPARRCRYSPRMQQALTSWVIDPADPRAPPQEIWDEMTPAERQHVVDSLPSKRDMVQTHAFDECCQPGVFPLPGAAELITWLGSMVGDLATRMEEAERRAEETERRAEEAERALAEALAEIDRLKRERP